MHNRLTRGSDGLEAADHRSGRLVIETGLATAEQREECYRLAYEVFCEELGALRAQAEHGRRIVRDEVIERAHVFCARVDGEIVGSVGVLLGSDGPFPSDFERGFGVERFLGELSLRQMAIGVRFLVAPRFRQSLVPVRLLVEAGRFQIDQGVALSFCDCQPHLVPLYTSVGFRPCAPLFDQPGFGVMVPLAFVMSDREHMRAVRAATLRYYPESLEDPVLAGRIRALLPSVPPVQDVGDLDDEALSDLQRLLSQSIAGAFSAFSSAELRVFLEHGQLLRCDRGLQIIVDGQRTDTVYVVLDGAVEVRKHGVVLGRYAPGDVVGDFAFLLRSKRTADVFAASDDVRLLAIGGRQLSRMMETHPELAAKFFLNRTRALAQRLGT